MSTLDPKEIWTILALREQGWSPEEIEEEFPRLKKLVEA